jgi:hypothetical protein
MPKVWCRDPANQFAFVVTEEQCHVTATQAAHQLSPDWEKKHEATKRATQVSARFRDGREPDFEAGLDLGDPSSLGDDGALSGEPG